MVPIEGVGDLLRERSCCDELGKWPIMSVETRSASCEARALDATTVEVDGAYEDVASDNVDADAFCRYHSSFGGGGGGFWPCENLLNRFNVESLDNFAWPSMRG